MQLSLPLAGTTLSGRYRLDRVLGEGASSVVFAAHDLRLTREVAIKVLKPQAVLEASAQRERFLSEARTLAQLAHPHIVPIFDVGETEDGVAYFVMELAGEQTLASELETRGSLPLQECLTLLLPLLGALALAHGRGVIHRDLKPANIVLDGRAQGRRARVLDFGIAKAANVGGSSGVALGTPAYMAPEQASAGQVGPFTDVWAMGVLFFRCLAGRLPFEAQAPTGLLLKIVNERAPRFAVACSNLPPHVAVALDQALEPSPEARPSNLLELAQRLAAACRQDGVPVPSDPDPIGLPEFGRWLASADVESTHRSPRLAPSKPSDFAQARPAAAVSPEVPVARKATRPIWVYGLFLLVVASMLLAGAQALWSEPIQALRSTRPAPERRGSSMAAAKQVELAVEPSAPAIVAPSLAPATTPASSAPLPATAIPRESRPKPKRPTKASVPSTPGRPDEPQDDLVRKWDW